MKRDARSADRRGLTRAEKRRITKALDDAIRDSNEALAALKKAQRHDPDLWTRRFGDPWIGSDGTSKVLGLVQMPSQFQ